MTDEKPAAAPTPPTAEIVAVQDIYNSAKNLTYGSANWDQFYVMVKARVCAAIQQAVEERDREWTRAWGLTLPPDSGSEE